MRPVIAAFVLVAMTTSLLAEERCMVSDPTGTPLNIRTAPNGAILGTYDYGTIVRVARTINDDRGRPWALVGPQGEGPVLERGWVFKAYLTCF